MKLSFIIPALDEEKRIGSALRQFKALDCDFEVIVADGGSIDRTRDIAREHGATVVMNSRETQNIAKNRNLGARAARGDLFVFCDADTRLKDIGHFCGKVLETFRDRTIAAAAIRVEIFPAERKKSDHLYHMFYSAGTRLSFFLGFPLSGGQCQIVRKSNFWKVGGYDEFRVHAEDSFLFQKLQKTGKLAFIDDLVVYESARRYRKHGAARIVLDSFWSYLVQIVFRRNAFKRWEKID